LPIHFHEETLFASLTKIRLSRATFADQKAPTNSVDESQQSMFC